MAVSAARPAAAGVEIEVLCRVSATNITLHAADLEIDNSTVNVTDLSTGDDIEVVDVAYDEAREFFILNTGSELEQGKKYVIKIQYTAFLKDNLKGFYRFVLRITHVYFPGCKTH